MSVLGHLKQLANLLKKGCSASPREVERAERHFFLDYLTTGMVVFDVGAHIGELTLLFSQCVEKEGVVHSFEPTNATFRELRRTCQAAHRTNVRLNQQAVGAHCGRERLHVYSGQYSSWNTLARRPLDQYGISVESEAVEVVDVVTLDKYCRQHELDRIDLLKLDVEGLELQVMHGARRMLEQKRIRCCTFEFGATTFDAGNTPEEIEYFLGSVGYEVRNIVDGDTAFPGRKSADTARFSVHVATPQS